MACELCIDAKIDAKYDTVTGILHLSNTCVSPLTNNPCTVNTGYNCASMCSGCGGSYYFTTNGSGVVSCFTNAGCTSSCVTVDELGASRAPLAFWGITLVLLVVGLAVFTGRRSLGRG